VGKRPLVRRRKRNLRPQRLYVTDDLEGQARRRSCQGSCFGGDTGPDRGVANSKKAIFELIESCLCAPMTPGRHKLGSATGSHKAIVLFCSICYDILVPDEHHPSGTLSATGCTAYPNRAKKGGYLANARLAVRSATSKSCTADSKQTTRTGNIGNWNHSPLCCFGV